MKKVIFTAVLICTTIVGFSQKYSVSGQVVDKATGKAIKCQVMVSMNIHGMSDKQGNFKYNNIKYNNLYFTKGDTLMVKVNNLKGTMCDFKFTIPKDKRKSIKEINLGVLKYPKIKKIPMPNGGVKIGGSVYLGEYPFD